MDEQIKVLCLLMENWSGKLMLTIGMNLMQ